MLLSTTLKQIEIVTGGSVLFFDLLNLPVTLIERACNILDLGDDCGHGIGTLLRALPFERMQPALFGALQLAQMIGLLLQIGQKCRELALGKIVLLAIARPAVRSFRIWLGHAGIFIEAPEQPAQRLSIRSNPRS